MKNLNYVYILECAGGSYYTGWTNHLKERVEAHQSGHGARYTRSHLPVRLVYYECFETKVQAMQREYAIKRLTHTQKEQLVYGKTILSDGEERLGQG